jgi:hypothetical protein
MVARDARYSVRVVLPGARPTYTEAAEAAERVGVDLTVQQTRDGATVYFSARHQDRQLSPRVELRPLVHSGIEVQESDAPPLTNVAACQPSASD